MNENIFIALKLLMSITVIFSIFYFTDINEIKRNLVNADLIYLTLSVALIFAQYVLVSIRWKIVLNLMKINIPFKKICFFMMTSNFVGQILPSSVGSDLIRVYLLKKNGIKLGDSFVSVVVERLFGLLSLAVSLVFFVPLFAIKYSLGDLLLHQVALVFFIFCFVLTSLAFCILFLRKRLGRSKVVASVYKVLKTAWKLGCSSLRVVWCFFITIFGYTLLGGALFFVAKSFGANLFLIDAIAIVSISFFLLAIPISIAGWGVREGILIFLLVESGMFYDNAVSLSFAFGVLFLLAALPGMFTLMVQGVSLRDVKRGG